MEGKERREEGEGTRSEEKIIIRVSTVTRRKGEREEGRIRRVRGGEREGGIGREVGGRRGGKVRCGSERARERVQGCGTQAAQKTEQEPSWGASEP